MLGFNRNCTILRKSFGGRVVKIILLVMLVGVVAFTFRSEVFAPANGSEIVRLKINERIFSMEVARTLEQQQIGLSNRDMLAQDRGMLFVFDQPAIHCFWMKDTRFPLDILWLDADKKIVYQKRDVSPTTYPESFCPDKPAKYVIEFNAGASKGLGLEDAQQLTF